MVSLSRRQSRKLSNRRVRKTRSIKHRRRSSRMASRRSIRKTRGGGLLEIPVELTNLFEIWHGDFEDFEAKWRSGSVSRIPPDLIRKIQSAYDTLFAFKRTHSLSAAANQILEDEMYTASEYLKYLQRLISKRTIENAYLKNYTHPK